jgi:hypothetical protein
MWTLQFDSTCEGPGFGVAVADPVAAGDSTDEADQVPTQRCRYAGGVLVDPTKTKSIDSSVARLCHVIK